MFTKNRLILILGLLVALLPFLGFPSSWRTFFYVVFGLIISTLSFLLARHKRIVRRNPLKKQRSNEVYAETAPVESVTAESASEETVFSPTPETVPEPTPAPDPALEVVETEFEKQP